MAEEKNLRRIAAQMAERYGVDPQLYVRLIERESGFDPKARGAAGELGLSQIMAETARAPGYGVRPIDDRLDPVENLRFGAEYLAALVRAFDGDYTKALQAYNGGVGNVKRGTTSDAARNYASELLAGVQISTKGGEDLGPRVSKGVEAPIDPRGMDDIAALVDQLFPERPRLRAPSAPDLQRTREMGQMSPLSRLGIPGLGAIDTYSAPRIQAVTNPSMGGIGSLTRGR